MTTEIQKTSETFKRDICHIVYYELCNEHYEKYALENEKEYSLAIDRIVESPLHFSIPSLKT